MQSTHIKFKFISFLIAAVLIVSSLTISVHANEQTNEKNIYNKNVTNNVEVIDSKISENCNNFRLKIEVPTDSKTMETESDVDISAIDSESITTSSTVMYLDVSIYGSGGKVYGSVYRIGSQPHNLTISLYNGTYSASTKVTSITTTSVGSILSPTKISSTPTATKFWDVTISGTINGASVFYHTDDFVFNKKGVEYPKYTDSLSGKVMTVPATNWTKVTNPVAALTTAQRNAYKTWYESTYNNGKVLDWSNVQVHHIKPRAYGGKHDYSNLIPLNTSFHTTVTTWWANY